MTKDEEIAQLKESLAAEREKLAAAQATIAEHNKDFTNQIDSTCYAIPATGLRDYHDVPFPEGTQPTGEWTVESVRLMAVVNTKGAERIVAAHNAERSKIWREAPDQPDVQEAVIKKLDLVHRHAIETAVAAEREKVRVLTEQMQKDFQRDL